MTIYDRSLTLAFNLIERFKNPSQVTLERVTRTANGSGGYNTAWAAIGSYDHAMIPESGNERLQAFQLEGRTMGRLYALYSDLGTATTDDRLVFEGRTLNIRAVMDIAEAKSAVEIIYEEGVQ